VGAFFEYSFTAKCLNEWAIVTVSGGDDISGFRQFVDVEEPLCQDSIVLPEFNPRKRCVWQFQIPCGCGPGGGPKLRGETKRLRLE
jgi:hypothetical protein